MEQHKPISEQNDSDSWIDKRLGTSFEEERALLGSAVDKLKASMAKDMSTQRLTPTGIKTIATSLIAALAQEEDSDAT